MIDLRHGDCGLVLLEAFSSLLRDLSWDVMIVDPPYRAHVHEAATSCGTPGARPSAAMKGAAHRDMGFDHLSDEMRDWVCRTAASVKRWSAIFTDTESVGDWQFGLEVCGATYVRSIPWVRWSMPQLSGDRPPQGHEMVVVAWGSQRGKKSWNGPGNLTHFAHTCMRGKDKHKAQKPLDLVLDLVEYFSEPGELVCDPMFGSGTTALACALLDRNFVGSELDGAWVERTRERMGGEMYDDAERYDRYLAARAVREKDMERIAENTARIRANREAQGR
jgi:hypothetical protein